ncbi:DNA-processing protein DprA [Curtobacterium oceanosedimentum]|uniref:DNA-processing protein DprA n=1 Tax=Curtobacterium oceanosedimentum TaxID=465820 RepID=UPI001CE060FC|nr:DNA-processing protein DprA [Curtobacterium oceanosedimentum]MCA5924000.1 DNA-processing protein DprA [Curtobacterium oceanosedimentum]
MTPVGTELLDAVVRLLGRSGGAVDPAQAAARVAWSAVVEPGDSVAGELLSGLGPERALGAVLLAADDGFDTLLGRCVEAEVAGAEDPAALLHGLKAAVERWTPRLSTIDVGDVLAAAGAVGAGLLVPESDEWPSAMDDLGPHAPVVLWTRSAAAQLGGGAPALGVVGSRANTVAGADAAAEITSTAADAGCTIVSGGAYGIDAVAHRVAIAAGTPTVAVLAGGIDQLYPAGNAQLLHNVARQGALLAESAPGTRPTRWRFLARNRLIAALADVTVVVEAGARSGALNTAHHAAQLGRPVFAVPGAFASSASVGCHRLIAQGRAQIVVHPADPVAAARPDVTDGRAGAADAPLLSGREDPEVLRVLDALGRRALPESEIARRSGMSVADVTDALALAQLQGLVVVGNGGWARA